MAWQDLALVIGLAIVPPFLIMLYFWSRERRDREPFRAVLGTFLYGGTAGIVLAILLHQVFEIGFATPQGNFGLDATFVAIVIAAPIVEELSKGLGLGFARPHIRELEDGIVYGASIGLGFAATENLLYGLDTMLSEGTEAAVAVVSFRIVSSTLLHLGASALLGFAYGRAVIGRSPAIVVLPYYLVAVILHASYNFLVSVDGFGIYAFVAAIVLVVLVAWVLKRRIDQLDALPHE